MSSKCLTGILLGAFAFFGCAGGTKELKIRAPAIAEYEGQRHQFFPQTNLFGKNVEMWLCGDSDDPDHYEMEVTNPETGEKVRYFDGWGQETIDNEVDRVDIGGRTYCGSSNAICNVSSRIYNFYLDEINRQREE